MVADRKYIGFTGIFVARYVAICKLIFLFTEHNAEKRFLWQCKIIKFPVKFIGSM